MAPCHAFLTFGLKFQVKVHSTEKNNHESPVLAFPNFTKTGKSFLCSCHFWQSFDPHCVNRRQRLERGDVTSVVTGTGTRKNFSGAFLEGVEHRLHVCWQRGDPSHRGAGDRMPQTESMGVESVPLQQHQFIARLGGLTAGCSPQ